MLLLLLLLFSWSLVKMARHKRKREEETEQSRGERHEGFLLIKRSDNDKGYDEWFRVLLVAGFLYILMTALLKWILIFSFYTF